VWTEVDDRPGGAPVCSRRAVLRSVAGAAIGIAGASGLSGCGLLGNNPAPDRADPLDGLLAGTLALASRYDTAIAVWPELTERLTPIRDAHRAHATALATLIGKPTKTTAPSVSSVSSASSTSSVSSTSSAEASAADALASLRTAEKTAQGDAATACLAAPAARAPTLGSITAARASHQEALR
jgi:hypothetical protein